MSPNVSEIQFNQMPDSQTMAMYRDWLIVYDNISTSLKDSLTEDVMKFIDCFPLKIDFIIGLLCLEGKIEIGINLRQYTLTAGDLIIVGPGTIGESVNIAPESKLVVLTLAPEGLGSLHSVEKEMYKKVNFRHPVTLSVAQEMLWPFVQEYQHLKHTILSCNYATDNLVYSYLSLLASYVMIALESNKIPQQSVTKLYSDFMDHLAQNCIEHRDIAFYADACGLSQKYFAKQIFQASGKHPKDWIKAQVILHAEAMLRSGNYSVAAVSKELNFSSMSVFNRYFKEATGVTPKDYKDSK